VVDLAGLDREPRPEEVGTGLVLGEVGEWGDLALDGTRALGAAAVDEAGLADLAGEKLLQMGERFIGFPDGRNLRPNFVAEPARLLVDVLERRVVRQNLRQRPGSLERLRDALRVLLSLEGKLLVLLAEIVAVLHDRGGDEYGDERCQNEQ
jgi:hypothetical protein